ncbi:high-affinity branched-chain amino acid transport system permease protein LivH [Variibacter gotjawalensis]|uniref:High-affinity branched-chain amino acid transport system permease protein LivH n=1 Tax=Variibacter gotjawalensis TaxID=1333996 RepID=A0A0S3PSB5_9BRAD|nr:urea ABC transporter permease subunit UrtB [Variibacter gotjawalensis]NIK49137.1 urea transport system permease protein [Variibacter gotjawalensis]RZS50993.1 amino acid/amide ABC transporter membrane protein 1 (HAAT family) [Variibacter gotjawalensis]BAT58827.1 high-affinity branched-chain amino acid transport system permease protein LivH [Variibacter gotjawalensis]
MTFFRFIAAGIFLLALSLSAPIARAQDFAAALADFTTDSFSDTEKAVTTIATSGNPRAADVIQALQDGRLFFTTEPKAVFIRTADGKFADAATGQAATPASPRPVRLNNRLRRSVDAALGGLTLLSPDANKRLEAAISVFRSRDAAALPTLDTAIAKETNTRVKRALTEARAAVILFKTDASETDKLDAVAVLRARGDQEAKALLSSLPADSPTNVKTAAQSAVAAIESNLALWATAQNAWYGISLGSVLLLAAIGLAITFGVMGVINMAHGEMVMLGAYTTFVVQEIIRTKNPALFDYSLLIALPLAFCVAGLVGIAIERGVIRWLYGRPLETLLATWGISLILQQAVRTQFGPTNKEVGNPSWMSGAFEVGGLTITYNRLWIVCFTLAVFVGLLAMLRFSRIGLEMRAVTQNRAMAASMGIRTGRIDALTFGLGSGIAGIAGVALSQIDNVSPNLGQSYIIDSFMVVVFGGVGNLWGTLVGAFTLGIANKFLEPFAGAVLGKIAILVLIILFIQKRPRGLFALKGRAVEA